MAGKWVVIARLPAQEGELAPSIDLAMEGNTIRETYTARGAAAGMPMTRIQEVKADDDQPARWSIKDGWLSSHERWVLYASPSYRYALIGDPQRAFAWVLARDTAVPEWSYSGLVARLAVAGYEVDKLQRLAP